MQPIYTQTASGSATTIAFNNIPQTFTDLKVVISARTTASANRDATYIGFNGSFANYSRTNILGLDTNAVVSNRQTNAANIQIGDVPAATATANTFSNLEVYIPNYTSSIFKAFSSDSTSENNSTTSWVVGLFGLLWSNTAPITSLIIYSGTFTTNSTFTLYGITKG